MSAPALLVAALRAAAAPRRTGGRLERRLRAAAVRALVPRLLARGHLSDALDALAAPGTAISVDRDAGRIVEALARWPITCLHRAVSAWAILRSRGEDVRLLLGVRTDAGALVAHAWIERDGAPVGEGPDVRSRYAVAYEHPPRPAAANRTPEPCVNAAKQDVILTELEDGTGVLLHLGTRFYYTLNRTGVAAWKLLSSGEAGTAEELTAALARAFDGAAPAEVRRDVDALLRELRDEGLLGR